MDNRPIGVSDSGLGGLTVVRQLMRQLPGESIVYFGDTGRIPYGTRSPATIEKYARQAGRFLMGENVKLIIAACGTVSSVAPQVLRELPVPAIGVVEPAAAAAAATTRNRRIGVLGTAATIQSGAFTRRIQRQKSGVSVVAQACPVFVTLVENGWIERDDEVTRLTARRYLAPLLDAQVDTVLLGCTHFPLLAPVLGDILGGGVALVDAGREAAVACTRALWQRDALSDKREGGAHRFYVSDRPEDFLRTASVFLGGDSADGLDIRLLDPDSLQDATV